MVDADPTSIGDYFDLSKAKKRLEIDQKSIKYDETLTDIGEESNRDLEDLLYTISGTINSGVALTGTEKESADNFVLYRVCYLFKVRQNAPMDIVKIWKDLMTEKKDTLIKKLKAQPETNTQSDFVVVTSDYQSDIISN